MENSIKEDINKILTLMDKNHQNKLSSSYGELEGERPGLDHSLSYNPGKKQLTSAYFEGDVEYENKEGKSEPLFEGRLKNNLLEKKS